MAKDPKRIPPKVVVIIPARGGNQSVPWKNLRKLGGKPLLWWAIDVGLRAKLVDAVTVSTEDSRIARSARRYGAMVIPRPKEFAQPTSDDVGFYQHAVTWMRERFGWKPELVVNLRPTSPLRFPEDVDACVRYVLRTGCDGLKTVIPSPIPPYKLWWAKGRKGHPVHTATPLEPFFDTPFRRTHGPDLGRQRVWAKYPVYWQEGSIDITRPKFIMSRNATKYRNVFGPNIRGYIMDPRQVVDIDTAEDLREAAKVWRQLRRERGAA
ncbi:MAG: N-acylneuraminate cytidylyltransferase [Parcubacteria group bacterium Gr01-1014_38]|nr:MAG: N-acylneuraminate cytidylyltransferase [Parcubacteria group bacterium Gr01-1014_38]